MLKKITNVNDTFWFKCQSCGCFVVIDKTNPKISEFRMDVCPYCASIGREDYPFKFITRDEYDSCDWIKDSLLWLENIETM